MPNRWLLLAALIAATLVAYQPAWHGGILWDDAGHLTREDLRTASGLGRIWIAPGSTQQYYPVLHSAFWLQYALWGQQTLGYHLVNIVLHACSAWLLGLVLIRLGLSGAWMAAAVFALHPVHVESVAWISELKNVLSGVFYLGSALAYLRYDTSRNRAAYATALVLFLFAILSKTVTSTLPAALLVVCWWRRGTIDPKRDVLPLAPFAALGVVAGLVTIWFERSMIGATGEEYALHPMERVLVAGRAILFYAGKIVWPANLTFVYPRWDVSRHSAAQYLYPLAVALAVAAAWAVRNRSRAPLTALLLFAVALFPALGFFNVYPFRYSYVADHFQYLATIAPIALICAAAARTLRGRLPSAAAPAAATGLVLVLGFLTWRQAHDYASAEALYRATLARNPAAWMALNNLSVVLLEGEPSPARVREALSHAEGALRMKPDLQEARYNLGTALERLGHFEEAAAHYEVVLEREPDLSRVRHRLGVVLRALGRGGESVSMLRSALALAPAAVDTRVELGRALAETGQRQEAIRVWKEALALQPASAEARHNLGAALRQAAQELHKAGRLEQAASAYREALAVDPSAPDVHNDLGAVLATLGRMEEAVRHFGEAVRLNPGDAGARENYARARQMLEKRR